MYAFYLNPLLASVVLPESLTSVGNYSFTGSGLTSIYIPDALTWIGGHTFENSTSLECVNWNPDIPRWVGDDAFKNVPNSGCPPTVIPSLFPSAAPTGTYSPSTVPTLMPSCEPTEIPTLRPTTVRPSIAPSMEPSIRPSNEPTEAPTHYPTSRPTHVECPVGYIHDFNSTVDTDSCHFCECKPCLPGQYAPPDSMSCFDSPPGYYAPINATIAYRCSGGTYSHGRQTQCTMTPAGYYTPEGSSDPYMCPPNTYAGAGQASCTSCPSDVVSVAGSTSLANCVSPKTSFGISFVALALSLIGFIMYIVGGRLHRMAFKRRQTLIRKCSAMYNKLCDIILALSDFYRLYSPSRVDEKLFYWVRALLLIAFAILMFAVFLFVFIYHTFYTCVIIYRGYVHLPHVVLPSLVQRFELYISTLEGFSFSAVQYLSYPFQYIVNFLAKLSIDFSGAQVTCVGAQIPMQLLANVLVMAVVVLVIESDMEVFWCSAYANVHREFNTLLLKLPLWSNRVCTIFVHMMWSILLQIIPHPRSILQFVIGFFSLVPFFDNNYHAKHSPSCDYGSYYKVDSFLAYSSTVIAYAAILPLMLIFSQILVPRFMLDRGVVKPKWYIQKRLYREGEKCRCGLPLVRQRRTIKDFPSRLSTTGSYEYIGSLICNNHHACGCRPEELTVIYGCPRYQKCEWALCRSCGNSAHDDMLYTVEYARGLVDGTVVAESTTIEESLVSGRMPTDRSNTMSNQDVKLLRCQSTISNISNHDAIYTPLITYLKYLGSLFALDWLYVRFAYSFGQSLVPVLDPASYKYGHNLSWFASHKDKSDEYEHVCIELEWTYLAGTSASYYRMVRTVQQDLTPPLKTYITCCSCDCDITERFYFRDITSDFHICSVCEAVYDNPKVKLDLYVLPRSWSRYIVEVSVMVLSYTPLGQLCSEKGRLIWWQVFLNYFVYLRAAFGWWDTLETTNFDLIERFRVLGKTDAIVTHRNIFDPTPVLDKANIEDENLQVMAAVISSRLVLIQLIPYMTLLSAFAVNLCSSPVFVKDAELQRSVPPLFVTHGLRQMAMEALMDVGVMPTWQVSPMALYLFVRRSRGVQFILNAITSTVAVVIVFSKDVGFVSGVMVFSLVLTAIMCVIAAIYPVILVHYMLFPTEKVIHCEVVKHIEDEEEVDCEEEERNERKEEQENPIVQSDGMDDPATGQSHRDSTRPVAEELIYDASREESKMV